MNNSKVYSPSAKYLKSDSKEYYYLCNGQQTILKCDVNTDLLTILSDEGLQLFKDADSRYKQGQYNDTITKYTINTSKSGFWFADKTSKYYNPSELHTYLNSWNNIYVTGLSQRQKCNLYTSTVILITDKWCLTRNKSLYKLQNKLK